METEYGDGRSCRESCSGLASCYSMLYGIIWDGLNESADLAHRSSLARREQRLCDKARPMLVLLQQATIVCMYGWDCRLTRGSIQQLQ